MKKSLNTLDKEHIVDDSDAYTDPNPHKEDDHHPSNTSAATTEPKPQLQNHLSNNPSMHLADPLHPKVQQPPVGYFGCFGRKQPPAPTNAPTTGPPGKPPTTNTNASTNASSNQNPNNNSNAPSFFTRLFGRKSTSTPMTDNGSSTANNSTRDPHVTNSTEPVEYQNNPMDAKLSSRRYDSMKGEAQTKDEEISRMGLGRDLTLAESK
jgi:hypothetical protein